MTQDSDGSHLLSRRSRSSDRTPPFAKICGILAIGACIVLTAIFARAARGPDRTLEFTREVHTDCAPEELAHRLSHLKEWPQWFHSLDKAQVVDESDRPLPDDRQIAAAGARLRLEMDPHKGPLRHFEMAGRITEYEPGRKLTIRILDESSGRLTQLFSNLEWSIELAPQKVIGREIARTASWRARLFGTITPKILLNQTFYPDVIRLADPSPARASLLGSQDF